MPSLVLTTDCQRSCSYCFAINDKKHKSEFTWDNFVKAVEFVSTGMKAINLLGGEPTLHDRFIDMLKLLIEKDYYIQIFTNGLLSEKIFDDLSELLDSNYLTKDKLTFGININESKYCKDGEEKLQEKFLKNFYKNTYLAFTIQDVDTDLTFLRDKINSYNLLREIRLGMALPMVGCSNKYLSIESYDKIANNIMYLYSNCEDIALKFDCGFPMCMFNLKDLSTLNSNIDNDIAFLCGQPLDIYPDLTISNCFPLSIIHKRSIDDFSDIKDAYEYFSDGFSTPAGIYGDRCIECTFFRKVCFGGCKGFYKPGDR